MSVYFVRAHLTLKDSDTTRVKIGKSNNPEERYSDLRTPSPVLLDLLHVLEGSSQTEGYFHSKFSMYNVRGEWFDIPNDILCYVITNLHTREEAKKYFMTPNNQELPRLNESLPPPDHSAYYASESRAQIYRETMNEIFAGVKLE